jgi:[ribosomal protein S5]-alanine N-acetyltransferase
MQFVRAARPCVNIGEPLYESSQCLLRIEPLGLDERAMMVSMTAFVPPDPPLAGERISLRLFRVGDAGAVARSCQDPDIPRFTMMPDSMTKEQARQWIERGLEWWPKGVARFAITVQPSEECVGQVGVHFDLRARRAEAFYWLDRRVRGQGLAVESLDLVTRWAIRDFDIVRMQLVTHVDNLASQRVAERCGYVREGVLRAWEPVKNDQPDVVMYSRVATDR